MHLNLDIDRLHILSYIKFTSVATSKGLTLNTDRYTLYLCTDMQQSNCVISFHDDTDIAIPHFETLYNKAYNLYMPVINNGWVSDLMKNIILSDFKRYHA